MAYVCESLTIIDSVSYGINCVNSGFLELTPEARDELLKFVLKIFAAVYVGNKVVSIFK